jgi:long-chain-fatty-acid--[acyl-carrier-protein] ligase
VVLFTSGSEKAPKAVPLTHANIIGDQRGCLEALKLDRHNSALGFLPMFHSFGLTVTGLLPLFVGVRVVHHPDPTDSGALVRKIAAYKPTIALGTPTFISYILERAKPGDLDSLTLIIVGAEKAPPALFEKAKQIAPNAQVLEGYGITECAPVVAVNRPGALRPGTIGQPLPGVEVCVTDLQTNAVLPPGQMGMMHVAGPTVFPGYIGHDGPPPFEEIGGKKWYVTGDLAELDGAGAIVFRGRLKRFLKAGGEMISLPALEEPFARKYPPTDQGPRVAVEGVETPDGRRIVLFTTEPIGLRDANALLQAEGHRGVMRLDDVKQIEKIPTLGTGKDGASAGPSSLVSSLSSLSAVGRICWVLDLIRHPHADNRLVSRLRCSFDPHRGPERDDAPLSEVLKGDSRCWGIAFRTPGSASSSPSSSAPPPHGSTRTRPGP